jgi:hypothetical protein
MGSVEFMASMSQASVNMANASVGMVGGAVGGILGIPLDIREGQKTSLDDPEPKYEMSARAPSVARVPVDTTLPPIALDDLSDLSIMAMDPCQYNSRTTIFRLEIPLPPSSHTALLPRCQGGVRVVQLFDNTSVAQALGVHSSVHGGSVLSSRRHSGVSSFLLVVSEQHGDILRIILTEISLRLACCACGHVVVYRPFACLLQRKWEGCSRHEG